MTAPGVIVMFAVRLVAVVDAAELTVTPLPKLTVDPALKFVPAPVIVTVRLSPGWPEPGKALRQTRRLDHREETCACD